MLTLVVDHSGRRSTLSFPGDSVSIGRAEDNDLRVGSRFVSQHHCRIEILPDTGHKLVDLDSQNGTRVNGSAVSQCRLRSGDRVDIGPITIWFEQAPDEVTASLQGDVDEVTDAGDDEVTISTRVQSGTSARLREALLALFVDFRKNFGDERGLAEVEDAVVEASRKCFPRPAFQRSIETAKLLNVTRAIATETDLNRVLNMILDTAIELTDSERGFLVLREESGQWRVRVARNFDQEAVKGAEHKISRNIAETVARTGKPICTVNAQSDARFEDFASVSDLKLRSVMCLPLNVRGKVSGTLYLDNRFKDAVYADRQLTLLEAFADHAALALENARLYQQNLENEEALDRRTAEVEELATVLGDRMNKSAEKNAEAPKVLTREGLRHNYEMIIGDSPAMIEMLRLLDRVIDSDLPVLVAGESGTGKELVAQAIHANSPRKSKPFVRENCAAIPESLLESELFGYKKGAFTGANSDRKGLFEEAHLGTIFLDEIGEMSLEMQSKLLRVLQNGEVRPVGGREIINVNVRLITASNRDLRQMVKDGKFREDLFFRLNVVFVQAPPLRERMEDLPVLVNYFLAMAATRTRSELKSVDPLAMRYLLAHHWPGNVRELQNEIQRSVALSGAVVTMDDLSKEITENRPVPTDLSAFGGGLKDQIKLATNKKEREIILRTLEECQWKKSMAAKKLHISRPTLDQKIRLFGLGPFIERGRHRTL